MSEEPSPEFVAFLEGALAKQGSASWLLERVGYCTASRFQDVIGKTKQGKYRAEREAYLWELVIERITGNAAEHWTSAAMEWGNEQESNSKMAYEAATGAILEPCGFIKHQTLPWVGCTPDALIDEDGGFESKSPFNTRYHLEALLSGQIDADHIAQVQGGMWITDRKWWDYQSYDPRLPAPLHRFCVRVERDEQYIATLAAEVTAFLGEVNAMVARLLVAPKTA